MRVRPACGGVAIAFPRFIMYMYVVQEFDSERFKTMGTRTSTKLNQDTNEQDNEQQCLEKPFWKRIIEIGQEVPIEEWEKLPRDFARNAKHYMYGAPREEDYEDEEDIS